ncbi:MAG: hypothetical protein KatS3mg052_2533 [Candidatus Roseilinea sp.]|nr:MAG: hypothetical protein KatS3mg052_2533 [Candidatus Roseilinea sp.]
MPEEFKKIRFGAIATPNLNGNHLSDAPAA